MIKSKFDYNKIVRMYNGGLPQKKISEKTGCSMKIKAIQEVLK